jgi:aromatic ring-opening dioxygenase LigB subunit
MEHFERKFIVVPKGEAEEVELSEEEKKRKMQESIKKQGKGVISLVEDKKFTADDKGNVTVNEGAKGRLAIKRPDGSIEKFLD